MTDLLAAVIRIFRLNDRFVAFLTFFQGKVSGLACCLVDWQDLRKNCRHPPKGELTTRSSAKTEPAKWPLKTSTLISRPMIAPKTA